MTWCLLNLYLPIMSLLILNIFRQLFMHLRWFSPYHCVLWFLIPFLFLRLMLPLHEVGLLPFLQFAMSFLCCGFFFEFIFIYSFRMHVDISTFEVFFLILNNLNWISLFYRLWIYLCLLTKKVFFYSIFIIYITLVLRNLF